MAGLGALALGALWLTLTTNPLTAALALLTSFTYVGHLYAAQARHRYGHLHRRIPRSDGPHARLDRRPRPHRGSGRGSIRHSLRLAVSSLYVDCWLYREDYSRAGIRMLAGRPSQTAAPP